MPGATVDERRGNIRQLAPLSAMVLADQRHRLDDLARRNDRSLSAELRQALRHDSLPSQ